MRSDYEDAVLRARILGNDVVQRELARRSLGREAIVLHRSTLEMAFDVALNFIVARGTWCTRTNSYDFFHVLESAGRIDMRRTHLRRRCRRGNWFRIASRWLRLSRFGLRASRRQHQ